jgi:hypothetical protein
VLWPDGAGDAEKEMNGHYRSQPLAKRDPGAKELMAIALRHDLLALRAAIVKGRGPQPQDPASSSARGSTQRLLLLISKVHEMDVAAGDLFRYVLSEMGLRHPSAAPLCRVIFTSTSEPVTPRQKQAAQDLRDAGSDLWAQEVALTAFHVPEEWQSAYEHHLLHWREDAQGVVQPFTLGRGGDLSQQMADSFLQTFHERVHGLPSLLAKQRALDVVLTYNRMPPGVNPLRPANDEEVFARAAAGQE